jgi:hypothetical protein
VLIELGNPAYRWHPDERWPVAQRDSAPRVTYLTFPDTDADGLGGYSMPEVHDDSLYPAPLAGALGSFPAGIDVRGIDNRSVRRLIIDGYLGARGGMNALPNHEVLKAVAGGWQAVSLASDATWVRSVTHPGHGVETVLADYFGCPVGAPADLEDTHWTRHGMPGVGPAFGAGIEATILGSGFDIASLMLGGGLLGETGTATATTATSLTSNSAVSHATNDLAGQIVVAWSNGVVGLITGNTSGTNTVLTVDRWYVMATPGGSAGSTPSGTTGYTIMQGSLPAYFAGLTNSSTPVTGVLSGEYTTAGGGLIRKISPYAHTAGTSTFTLIPVFTANGTDVLPFTANMIGFSCSISSTVRNFCQTVPNAAATFNLSGDSATYTETITV